MTYYMLYTWEGEGPWAPQFGDTDRECVEYEANDMVDSFKMGLPGVPRKHTRIVKFPRVPTERQARERAASIPQPKA